MNALVPTPLEGEVLTPRAMLAVVAIMHPLKTSHDLVLVPLGSSVAEIVDACALQSQVSRLAAGARVTIDGHPILREHWTRVRPKDGAHVMVRAVPGKGAGNILKSVLSIALVAVASIFFGPAGSLLTGALGSAVGAAVVIGGSLLLGALFPPSTTKAETAEETYSIASRRNDAHRWGPIPELFGHHRIAPKFATSPYTEPNGEDQDLYQLFVFGAGAMTIEDIRIGDTPIGEYQGVEIQVREGYASDAPQTLVPSQVVQEDFQVEPSQGLPAVRDGADGAVRLALDLLAPQGIGNVRKKDGSLENLTVALHIDVVNRDTGAVAYSQPYTLTGKSRDAMRRTVQIGVPKGRYFVRLTRVTPDHTGDDHLQQVVWTALRSYRDEPVIAYRKPVALVAVRIRASKQLNGAISDLTAICTRKMVSWDGAQWQADRQTRSPADAFRHVLQGPAIARPRTNDQIDWPALEHWADLCAAKGWAFDLYQDFRSSVPDTLRDICAAGRAVPIFRDGKWSVAMEDSTAPLVQMFTPRNVEGFTRAITYAELPHAFRCKFVNERKGWIEDELIVYADGYDASTATLFEQIEFPGVTNPDLIFRHARYRFAERILRRSFYSFTTDAEHLVLARGDRCRVSHYVVQRSAVQGRVIAVSGQTVTLDEPVSMAPGRAYAIETRRVMEHATIIATNAVSAVAGEGRVVTVTGTPPKAGDLFAFGEPTTLSGIYRVLRISPGSDLSATIELVDDARDIENADSGPIDAGDGVVQPAPPIASFRPRGLRLTEIIQNRPNGSVHISRLTWEMLPPPGRNVLSFLIVAFGEDGAEVRASVGGAETGADFENLQTGQWTFRVFAYIDGLGYTSPSDPITVGINIPWDQLGIGLGNVQPDIRYIFENAVQDRAAVDKIVEEFAALATASLTDLELEALRLNSETFNLGANIEETGARLIEETIIRQSETENLAARAVRVETRLDDPATGLSAQSAALDTLTSRTTAVEGGLETAAESIRGVRAEITDLQSGATASGQAIDVLKTTVKSQGDTIASESQKLTQITSRLTNAEDDIDVVASSVSSLRSTVTSQGNRITSEAERTDGVISRVSTAEGTIRGQASSLTSLTSRVDGTEHDITAIGERAEDTRARANNASAGATMRIVAQAGPSGVSIRHSYEYRLSIENENYQAAGWYVDLSASGVPTVVFDFSRFIITDSSNRKAAPFRFQDGTLFVQALVAASALVGQLRAQSVDTQSLTIGGVLMDRIGFGAVSNFSSGERGEFEVAATNREETIIGLNVQATTSKFTNLIGRTRINYGPNQANADVILILRANGQEIARAQYNGVVSGQILEVEYRRNFPLSVADGTVVNVQFNIFAIRALVRPYENSFSALSFVR